MGETAVVCGPGGASGVTYAVVSGHQVGCGTDTAGNALFLQVATLGVDSGPVDGGDQIGLDIGAAVLSVMAVAWTFRFLRRYIDTSGEG